MSKNLVQEPIEGDIKSKANRAPRKPMTHGGKMEKIHIPGYYVRYVNTDERNFAHRFKQCKDAWYEPVLRKEVYGADCERPDEPVTVADPAKPMAMKLPIHLREEDLAAKEKAANSQMDRALANNLGEYGNVKVSRGSGHF